MYNSNGFFVMLFIIQFQNTHEGFLRDLYITDLTHSLLTFLLFFQKLLLTGNIAAVTFCKHIFSHGSDRLSGNDLASYSRLDWNLEQMTRNLIFELLAHLPSALISGILMHDEGKCIHLFLVDQDVQLHQL